MSNGFLFRGKRRNWKMLQEEQWWVEGYAFLFDGKTYISTGESKEVVSLPFYDGADGDEGSDVAMFGIKVYEVLPDTVCQYTNLADRWSEKIWENDVCVFIKDTCNYDYFIVRFGHYKDENGQEAYGYYVEWTTDWIKGEDQSERPKSLVHYVMCENIDVVGNIYDNPELPRGV